MHKKTRIDRTSPLEILRGLLDDDPDLFEDVKAQVLGQCLGLYDNTLESALETCEIAPFDEIQGFLESRGVNANEFCKPILEQVRSSRKRVHVVDWESYSMMRLKFIRSRLGIVSCELENREALTVLASGVDVWNQWREDTEETTIDISGANLQGVDLAGANLKGVVLNGTDLSFANLERADLFRGLLRGACLYRANLKHANLMACLLDHADLTEASLRNATLHRARLRRAILIETDFSNASLSVADLENSRLPTTYFYGANLSGTFLTDAEIDLDTVVQAGAVQLCRTTVSPCPD